MKTAREYILKIFAGRIAVIISLVLFKLVFQFMLQAGGLGWLTADDYSRTVISWDWLQNPRIYSGVWLTMHFWINGIFIWLFNDLTLAPMIANTFFSVLTLIVLYLMFERMFGRAVAVISSLIYCVFPFQVWLSVSGMPEPMFFFFTTLAVYGFLKWYEKALAPKPPYTYIIISIISLNIANLLRYEGWFFTLAFILLGALISYRKFRFAKQFYINTALSLAAFISAVWWLYQNNADYGDPLFFIKETNRIFSSLSNAGFFQRFIQYPFFIFYIAPVTTVLGLWKIIQTIRLKPGYHKGNFQLVKIFLIFNLLELIILMLSGIVGSGGTNMISRYIVLNAMFFFPFAVWQLFEFRKYIIVTGAAVFIIVNIIWSFYYQPAYREDTYEVANLTRRLIERNYFEADDKIYFEPDQGYFDIFPLQVISNKPAMFTSDTIPTYFESDLPSSKKVSKKKREEEQLKLNILELRKYIEKKKIKLFIVRSDLLIDKLKKLSYKSEQVGDYHLFYISENKINYKRGQKSGDTIQVINSSHKLKGSEISFGKKLILKEYEIDNTNFGMNPQTVTLKWEIADISLLDSLATDEDDFGRYRVRLELAPSDMDSVSFFTSSNIFSERNTEEFFTTEEIKNIMIIKPFAMLNYSVKYKSTPFESGMYDLRLAVYDAVTHKELPVFRGDSVYLHIPEYSAERDSTLKDTAKVTLRIREHREKFFRNPYYPLGKIIAMFPNVNYQAIMKKSSDMSRVIIRNGFMLPFLNRYQGDHMLDIVFTYF